MIKDWILDILYQLGFRPKLVAEDIGYLKGIT